MKKRCPLSYAGKTLTHEAIKCGDHCAWYFADSQCCAIALIASDLKLRNYYKLIFGKEEEENEER